MYKKFFPQNLYYDFIQRGVIVIIVFLTSFYSYLLFHSLSEIIVIAIGFGVYMVTWNSRRLITNKYFVYLGIALFCVVTFDLLHTFSENGLDLFITKNSDNISTQFWLVARYLQGFSFLAAIYFIDKNLKTIKIFCLYVLLSIVLLSFILWWPIFPTAYIEGQGFTFFKKISDLIICLLYLGAILALYKKVKSFNLRVFKLLIWSLTLSLVSELTFLFCLNLYSELNVSVHLLKIISFNLIYMAFIEMALRKPYTILFKEVKDSEMNYRWSEQKFRTIFNNANVGMLMTSLEGKILEVNDRFLSESDYLREELLKIDLSTPNNFSNDAFNKKEFQEIKNGKLNYYEFENLYTRKNGEPLWGDTGASVLKDEFGLPQYILWVIKDVTQNKEVEKVKIEFISLASHQLRTHLTSVRLATELMLKGVSGPIDQKQYRYLNEIDGSVKLMSEMIKNLLNVSRIELGTLMFKLEPIDLVKNFNKIIEELSLQIKEKSLHITKEYEANLPLVIFDFQILRIIFENLLTNAINYTGVSGNIKIKVKVQGSDILLSINDNGCGVPEAEQGQIFDKLFRANNAKEINSNGTGLGLYIVKSVAEKTGVKVWFESQEGRGTTFYVTIPISGDQFNKEETKNAPSS